MASIRWGIIGPGNIAHAFASGLSAWDNQTVYAVASRDKHRAQSFADQYHAEIAYGSYVELFADEQVDAVYIATPHPHHKTLALDCIKAGKAVLCEKPLCVNAKDAQALVAAAREHNVFLMEAMWTRFLPALRKVRELIRARVIGEPRILTCDFGFRTGWDPESRLLNPGLAGGGLLDVGVYTIAMSNFVFGQTPRSVSAKGYIGESGVDEQNALLLQYARGGLSVLTSAVRTNTPHIARIDGTQGRLTIPNFWGATTVLLEQDGKEPEQFEFPHRINGYEYEAKEVARCIEQGLIESPLMTHQESIDVLQVMDEARSQMGLSYPFEKE